MNKTLRLTFAIRSTYMVNSVLFALKQIPLIKKLLPASLYGVRGLKIFANIVAAIVEFIKAFAGKLLYLYLFIYLASGAYQGVETGSLYLHIFFFLSIAGALMNAYLFRPTKEKYYAVILMRMNARECELVDYAYAMLKLIIGFVAFGTLLGLLRGVPLWACLLAPFSVSGMKVIVATEYGLRNYEKTKDATAKSPYRKLVWTAIFMLLAAAYGLPALGIVLPLWLSGVLLALPIIIGAFLLRKILRFPYYREYYQQILRPIGEQKALVDQINRDSSNKLISTDTTITSKRRGFEYLNELFIKRHRKLLWKASKRVALVAGGLIAALLVGFWLSPGLGKGINSFLMTSLPWSVFIMYAINRGSGFTRALFMNCDHSLLTYAFYKQPRFVLKLFRIRLREIVKVNLLPAVVIGLGLALLLYASGGTDEALNYLALAISIPALSVLFSVHYLTIYYLLQPYNVGTEMKSSMYQIVSIATYWLCFGIMKMNMPTLIFGAVIIAFCLVYSIAACVAVYRLGPRTFRLRG